MGIVLFAVFLHHNEANVFHYRRLLLLNVFPVWFWICLALGHLFDTYSSIIWPNQN
jgi:hypothetical protein